MNIEYIYPSLDLKSSDALFTPGSDQQGATEIGGSAVSFKDFVDVVNPLQQLPIIGDLYRNLTGDTISVGARVAGGFLLGGPVGFMMAAANAGLEAVTGADFGEHVFALLGRSGGHQYAAAQYKKIGNLTVV